MNRATETGDRLALVMLIALLYYLGAQFGYLFVLTPYSSTTLVWPPSGIALAAILVWGRIALVGIFVGAVLVNGDLTSGGVITPMFFSAIVISLGSTLSAYACSGLLKHYAPSAPLWLSPQDLLTGSILTMAACTIAAVIGVSSLYYSGQLPLQGVTTTLAVWWLGDFCGMIIFCPLVYVTAQHIIAEGPFWRRLRPDVVARATALNCLATVAALVAFISLWVLEDRSIRASLEREAHLSATLLQQALAGAERDIGSIQAMIAASEDHLTESEFLRFTRQLFVEKSGDPGTHGVGWSPRVNDPRAWELSMMANYGATPDLFEWGPNQERVRVMPRTDYFPIQYIFSADPLSRNAVGYDLGSNPVQRSAVERARDTAGPGVVAPITLSQSLALDQRGMMICLPVYNTNASNLSLDGRRESFLGVACGAYLMADLFNRFTSRTTADIELALAENNNGKAGQVYYSWSANNSTDFISTATFTSDIKAFSEINYGDKKWMLIATPGEGYVNSQRGFTPWVTLLLILIIGMVLSSILINRVTAQRHFIEERRKTRNALHEARAANEAKSYFMAAASHDIKQPLYALSILTDTLLMTSPPDNIKGLMRSLKDSIKEVSLHFDTLMDIGRFQDGSFGVKRSTFQLRELARRINMEIEPLCKEKGLRWVLDFDDVEVYSDSELLLRMIRNLLMNAVRYTEAGEIRCTAKLQGPVVELEVSDTGPGLSPSQQDLVFRGVVEMKDDKIHTSIHGLGLSIVNRISDSLGLKVQVFTRKGQGTRFLFLLDTAPGKTAET